MSDSSSRSPTPDGKADFPQNNLETRSTKNDDGDTDDVWDPAAEKRPRESSESPSSGEDNNNQVTNTNVMTAAAASEEVESPVVAAASSDWQAIWSAAYGAYYFYNTATQETTWINPLVSSSIEVSEPTSTTATTTTTSTPASGAALGNPAPSLPEPTSLSSQFIAQPSTTSSTSLQQQPTPSSSRTLLPASDQLGGIDPELAFLDPSLAYTGTKTSTGPVPTFTAKFNARSGRFAGADSRDPNHVSEYERAKRMSEAYFDVDAWKKQVEEQEMVRKRVAEGGEDPNAKRKRPTKADLVRSGYIYTRAQFGLSPQSIGKVPRAEEREENEKDCMAQRMNIVVL